MNISAFIFFMMLLIFLFACGIKSGMPFGFAALRFQSFVNSLAA